MNAGTTHGLLLGLDSATEYLALSLVQAPAPHEHSGGAELAKRVTQLGREHAARIMSELEALLQGAGAERGDIVGIGVGVGPGSYTGVRIGVATAVALGRAWGVPVGGSSTLLALLGADLEPGAQGVALLDARKGNVYALAAQRLPGTHPLFEPLGQPEKLPREDVEQRFPGLPNYEGAPDASILARHALQAGSLQPWYL